MLILEFSAVKVLHATMAAQVSALLVLVQVQCPCLAAALFDWWNKLYQYRFSSGRCECLHYTLLILEEIDYVLYEGKSYGPVGFDACSDWLLSLEEPSTLHNAGTATKINEHGALLAAACRLRLCILLPDATHVYPVVATKAQTCMCNQSAITWSYHVSDGLVGNGGMY